MWLDIIYSGNFCSKICFLSLLGCFRGFMPINIRFPRCTSWVVTDRIINMTSIIGNGNVSANTDGRIMDKFAKEFFSYRLLKTIHELLVIVVLRENPNMAKPQMKYTLNHLYFS